MIVHPINSQNSNYWVYSWVQRTSRQAMVGARRLEGIRMHPSRKSRLIDPKTRSALHLGSLPRRFSPGASHLGVLTLDDGW